MKVMTFGFKLVVRGMERFVREASTPAGRIGEEKEGAIPPPAPPSL